MVYINTLREVEEERKKEAKRRRREWRMRGRTSKREGVGSMYCVRVVLCNSSKDRTMMYRGDGDASVKR